MDFLTESKIAEFNRLLRLPQPALDVLYEAAAIVREHSGLRELLRQSGLSRIPVADADNDMGALAATVAEYPKFLEDHAAYLRTEMGDRAGMFAVILVLGLLDRTIAYYGSKRIPEEVLIETLKDLTIWMKHHYAHNGTWGLAELSWLLNHATGQLFRLGRLQFAHKAFNHAVVVLRNANSGEVVILSEPGVNYRRDGRVDGTNGKYESEQGWQARYDQSDDRFIVGNPIRSSGFASEETIRLSASDWVVVLRRGDPVLEVHIPEDGPMRPEQCRESFDNATRFYREQFPEKPYRAFVCTSWLLDPQLADLVPAPANITSFQKTFSLFPVLSDERETYRRVFGTDDLDPVTASRDTGLRRAIVEYAEAGHLLHGGAGLLLADAI
ncbi:acyltransferase domain-containing protein [Cohnella herbarum]|nr:acyltransferase domain-containing protein [Cohnella herbarum]